MFCQNTLEAANNRVVIEDIDFETMQELVRFIYCEKVSDIKKVALTLLPAADKVNEIPGFIWNLLIQLKFHLIFSTIW